MPDLCSLILHTCRSSMSYRVQSQIWSANCQSTQRGLNESSLFLGPPPYLLSSRINIVGPLRKRVASTSARIYSVVLGEEIREWFVGMSGCARPRFDIQVSDRQDHPNAR